MAWYLWVDDDKVGANCSDLSALSEKSTGFQGGKAAVAKNVNVALRQANLVVVALMECMGLTVYNYATNKNNLKNAILGTLTTNLRNGNAQYSVCGKLQLQSSITGANNFVFGFENESDNSNCTIFGNYNTTTASNQFVIGNHAKLQADTLFAIGVGTTTETKNALTVTSAGQVQATNEPQAATDVIRKQEYDKLVDGTQVVERATSAFKADAVKTETDYRGYSPYKVIVRGLYACILRTQASEYQTVMLSIIDLNVDTYGRGAYYDGTTNEGVKYDGASHQIRATNEEALTLVEVRLITSY